MKILLSSAITAIALSAVAHAVCPFTPVFSKYGTPCAPIAMAAPSLSGEIETTSACGVRVVFGVSLCCGTVQSQWLLIGAQPVSVAAPNGCMLLASPDFIFALPAHVGPTKIIGDLPQNPALVGTSIYLQGIVERVDSASTTNVQFTNGLEMTLAP